MRAGPHELEIQNVHGDAIRGPFDRLDLRERLYLGILTGDELVRPVGGRFRPMRSVPDFKAVLELKERGKPRPVVSRRSATAPSSAPAAPADAAEAEKSVLSAALPGASALKDIDVPDKGRAASIAAVTLGIGILLLLVAFMAVSMSL